MSPPRIGFGRPQECHGRCLLPVVALFSDSNGVSVIGSAAVLALLIIEGEQVYFTALSDEITPGDVLLCLGMSGQDLIPSGVKDEG